MHPCTSPNLTTVKILHRRKNAGRSSVRKAGATLEIVLRASNRLQMIYGR